MGLLTLDIRYQTWDMGHRNIEVIFRDLAKFSVNEFHFNENKMELLQSQAPAERELLGNSAVRTLDNRV